MENVNGIQSKDTYVEINITVGEMKEGDRVHFFWANFPDGSTVNGGSNIIKVSEEVDVPSSEWMEQEGWSEDKLEEFEKLRKSNKLVLVTLQTDYHSPSNVVMEKEMFVKVIRKEQI